MSTTETTDQGTTPTTSLSRREVVELFTSFFSKRGHHPVQGSTLVPPSGDTSVLFTTSGMHPLTENLLGRPHPLGRRLVNVQRCLRTTDLDEVGDGTHLTVFEMLGSWSLGGPDLGGYSPRQSLEWGVELLTGLGLRDRLHGTVFGGSVEDGLGPDLVSLDVLKTSGVPVERLSENWWSNGPTGPCGPDCELFVWHDPTDPTSRPSGTPSTDERWVEVWNHVFMEYLRHPDGSLTPLEQPNVDTGMGLERLMMVLERVTSVYQTSSLRHLGDRLPWDLGTPERRLVTDHLRSSLLVLGDGVRTSSTGRGYVLRRLVRRMLTTLWSGDPTRSLRDLPPDLVPGLGVDLGLDLRGCFDLLLVEEDRFRKLVLRSRVLVGRLTEDGPLSDDVLDDLHSTHGVPREISLMIERGEL